MERGGTGVRAVLLLLSIASSLGYLTKYYRPIDECSTPLKHLYDLDHYEYAHGCSGLGYHPASNSLLMIHDRNHEVYMISPHGELKSIVKFATIHDFECVEYDPYQDRLLVCQEGRRRVHYFAWDKITRRHSDEDLLEADGYYQFNTSYGPKNDGTYYNGGLEGMTVDPRNGNIIVVNERGPPELLEQTKEGVPVHENIRLDFPKDASGLAFDETDNTLWMVSDDSHQVYRMTLQGDVLDCYHGGFANEGIALLNNHDPPLLFIGWDRGPMKGVISVYEKPTPCTACTLPCRNGCIGAEKNSSKFYIPIPETRCQREEWLSWERRYYEQNKTSHKPTGKIHTRDVNAITREMTSPGTYTEYLRKQTWDHWAFIAIAVAVLGGAALCLIGSLIVFGVYLRIQSARAGGDSHAKLQNLDGMDGEQLLGDGEHAHDGDGDSGDEPDDAPFLE